MPSGRKRSRAYVRAISFSANQKSRTYAPFRSIRTNGGIRTLGSVRDEPNPGVRTRHFVQVERRRAYVRDISFKLNGGRVPERQNARPKAAARRHLTQIEGVTFPELAGQGTSRETGRVDLGAAVSQIISEVPDVDAIYVFGSVATGDDLPGSDVDVALLAPRKLDSMARFRLQERIAVKLGRSVDLVDLRAASTVMRVEVLRHGEVRLRPRMTSCSTRRRSATSTQARSAATRCLAIRQASGL
jgi:uncharacterized protein